MNRIHAGSDFAGCGKSPPPSSAWGLTVRALAEAYQESGSISGLSFEQAFQHHYSETVDALPWDVLKETRTSAALQTVCSGQACRGPFPRSQSVDREHHC
jgi:hypothetical protein